MRELTAEDGRQLAMLVNFFGELRLHHYYISLNFWSKDKKEALTSLGVWLDIPMLYQKPRHLIRLNQAETHSAYELMWDHLTRTRQFEFNATVDRQQLLIDERAAYRRERDRRYAEAAARPVPDYEQRHDRAASLYDNSDPAVQVIEDLTADMAIEAEMAQISAYKANQEAERKRQMTQGFNSPTLYAPKKIKRKYTRKK